MSDLEKQLRARYTAKQVAIDTALNGYLVRIMEMPDLRNPAKDEARSYVCKDVRELIELLKEVFGYTEKGG